ncbi:uncharacterized protein LOC105766921 [Gossypium raimondii]|uniref:uncharacterized protein LOC105766921 n=1 Tax=Gossypium raimondii TaxID=29730 RepID=UPI00227C3BB9|nr:uncharacterized protein LOC105766921 [Gossypium raimondii]
MLVTYLSCRTLDIQVSCYPATWVWFIYSFLLQIVYLTLFLLLQGNFALRLPLPQRFLSSLKSCALVVVSVSRNAHLKQLKSSTYQGIWIKIQPIDIRILLLNYIGYQFQGLGKFLVWLEPMALENQLLLKFSLGS